VRFLDPGFRRGDEPIFNKLLVPAAVTLLVVEDDRVLGLLLVGTSEHPILKK
jgi:hypothetical protein